ncbi:MAG: hypothetical protein J3Q66DRAFT_368535 [Benniella sp.]|nr:MAG: hypothetical protein J3Q66DRAFT_368535 [Benniella sp.]
MASLSYEARQHSASRTLNIQNDGNSAYFTYMSMLRDVHLCIYKSTGDMDDPTDLIPPVIANSAIVSRIGKLPRLNQCRSQHPHSRIGGSRLYLRGINIMDLNDPTNGFRRSITAFLTIMSRIIKVIDMVHSTKAGRVMDHCIAYVAETNHYSWAILYRDNFGYVRNYAVLVENMHMDLENIMEFVCLLPVLRAGAWSIWKDCQ